MPDTHPSGRPATPIDTVARHGLVADPGRPMDRFVSIDCWLLAKERQDRRITRDRLARLQAAPSHWPGQHLTLVPADAPEAPMVEGHVLSEVEEATQAARPAILRAVARLRGRRPTGGDAA